MDPCTANVEAAARRLAKFVAMRRPQALQHQLQQASSSSGSGGNPLAHFPEYCMPFLCYSLAQHPDFPQVRWPSCFLCYSLTHHPDLPQVWGL